MDLLFYVQEMGFLLVIIHLHVWVDQLFFFSFLFYVRIKNAFPLKLYDILNKLCLVYYLVYPFHHHQPIAVHCFPHTGGVLPIVTTLGHSIEISGITLRVLKYSEWGQRPFNSK